MDELDLKLPLPSLIILKNSIAEGIIPKPEDLEVGELALTLAPGEEGIWSKNSSGEIKNLREPSANLMWKDLFRVFESREIFEKELEDGKVSSDSICFIVTEKLIWTKGTYYASEYSPEDLEKIVSQRLIIVPEKVYELDPSTCSSSDIESAWRGEGNFKTIALNAQNDSVLAALKIDGGSVPVSIISKVNSSEDIELTLEWILDGKYYREGFVYKNGIFGIQKYSKYTFEEHQEEVDKIKDRLDRVEEDLCWVEAE